MLHMESVRSLQETPTVLRNTVALSYVCVHACVRVRMRGVRVRVRMCVLVSEGFTTQPFSFQATCCRRVHLYVLYFACLAGAPGESDSWSTVGTLQLASHCNNTTLQHGALDVAVHTHHSTIHAYTHAHTSTYTHAYRHIHIRTHTHARMHSRTYTHTAAYIHASRYTQVVHIDAHRCISTHKSPCTHTYL